MGEKQGVSRASGAAHKNAEICTVVQRVFHRFLVLQYPALADTLGRHVMRGGIGSAILEVQ